jgi:hypothetical protein
MIMKTANYALLELRLKKEIANNCAINIVPVIYLSGVPWDQIMPKLEADIEKSFKNLDAAANILVKRTMHDPELKKAMTQYIDGIRNNSTGNISYA